MQFWIKKAQTLLETISLSFESIAWHVGYQDSSSFNKVFTKSIGLTFTEYCERFKNFSLAIAI
jgi:transcriptional regulator GlxA family with amidase domain